MTVRPEYGRLPGPPDAADPSADLVAKHVGSRRQWFSIRSCLIMYSSSRQEALPRVRLQFPATVVEQTRLSRREAVTGPDLAGKAIRSA